MQLTFKLHYGIYGFLRTELLVRNSFQNDVFYLRAAMKIRCFVNIWKAALAPFTLLLLRPCFVGEMVLISVSTTNLRLLWLSLILTSSAVVPKKKEIDNYLTKTSQSRFINSRTVLLLGLFIFWSMVEKNEF